MRSRSNVARGHSNFDVFCDIMKEWAQLFIIAAVFATFFWVSYLLCFKINFIGTLRMCVSLIESYTWTSLFAICLIAIMTYEVH